MTHVAAQEAKKDVVKAEEKENTVKDAAHGAVLEKIKGEGSKRNRLFNHLAVGVDVVGPLMYQLADNGDYQAYLQASIRGTYLPIIELGYGKADKIDEDTQVRYTTKAPFVRLGCDYNVLRDKWSEYRLVIGLRYGFTSFDYDTSAPYSDEIPDSGEGEDEWGVETAMATGMLTARTTERVTLSEKGKVHWAEIVFGADAKVWGGLRMGWSLRYRKRLSRSENVYTPLYAPGYGNADCGTRFMALYNISFQF